MNTTWLTYAWADNRGPAEGDVDFVIQELERHGVSVRTDRRDLIVGRPLWPQIEQHISDESLCDAWTTLITANSLASKPCREELLYALERALDKRKAAFPIIGLFLGEFPSDLPKALAVRLCVSTNEQNWAARVAAGIRGEKQPIAATPVLPYHAHVCGVGSGPGDYFFEVRPRLGSWSPFCIGVPIADASRLLSIHYAPSSGPPPDCSVGHRSGSMSSPLPEWEESGFAWSGASSPAVTPSMAAHVRLRLDGPLTLRFGVLRGALHQLTVQPTSGA